MGCSFALNGLRGRVACKASGSASRRRLPVFCSVQEERPLLAPLAGAAAAALLLASPVNAGVILQQPQLKRIEASAEQEAPSKKLSTPEAPFIEVNIDIGSISLPLTLVGCVVLYLVASKLDTGFESFMSDMWVKDSTVNGVGYEEQIVRSANLQNRKLRK